MAKRSKNDVAMSVKKFNDIFGRARPTFDDLVRGLKEWCRSTLIKEDLNPDKGIIYSSKQWAKPRVRYAHMLLKYFEATSDGIARNDADYAAQYALKLGLLLSERRLKTFAERGRKQYRALGNKAPGKGARPRGRPKVEKSPMKLVN